MQDYEKLGAFYLGRPWDPASGKPEDGLVLYDSKDLVTHAVCFGMTGSGKTGLCIAMMEEAAIDGVPALVIDPKGDISNLLLTFPHLSAEAFMPWINEDDARSKGVAPEEYARQQAELWKNGLASWGQDERRIRRLRDAADFAVYTPGSTAGLPISILKSFFAPGPAIVEDPELLRERINGTATALLGLLGMQADPVQSREHILLATIFANAWKQGRDLGLAALIQSVQSPPVSRVGVLDLEAFYPAKERFALSMALNNLLASPGFEAWLEGEPLDIAGLLHTPQGKPRVSIFSIAHLGDAERMFFVSLLLNQTLGWMRAQSGTTSLRAILYMDEIFGYFPPVANPPSKQPLLTLLKQARAYGLGVVLATQNPVDLDYKGLSNAGTWLIGRLQTERDRGRVLDGLEGASGGAMDRQKMEQILSRLGNRVFLMNNVHEDAPTVFETRWTMSYLRGPLTRTQIKTLMASRARAGGASPVSDSAFAPPPAAAAKARNYATWTRDLVAWLYGSQTLELLRSPSSGVTSRAGESERDFRVRLQQTGRETRDGSMEKLRKSYAPRMTALQEKIRRAEQIAEREREQASQQKLQAALSVGSTLLGAFLGRKAVSVGTLGRASTAARAGSRTWKEMQDVDRASETVEALKLQLADMEVQFKEELQALESAVSPATEVLDRVSIKLKKTNIAVRLVALCWMPYWQDAQGNLQPAL